MLSLVTALFLVATPAADSTLRFPLTPQPIVVDDPWPHSLVLSAQILDSAPRGIQGPSTMPAGARWFAVPLRESTDTAAVYGVQLQTTPLLVRFALDENGDGRLSDERVRVIPRESENQSGWSERIVVRQRGEAYAIRLDVDRRGRLHYRRDDVWATTLRVGGGVVSLRLIRLLPDGHIALLDPESDGTHTLRLNAGARLPLGGQFWDWSVDADSLAIVLTSTDAQPIMAGYRAPDVELPLRESAGSLRTTALEARTVLVFCYAECPGCKLALPFLDSLSNASNARRIVQVSTSNAEADALKARGLGLVQSVSPEAWPIFAVTPTPTFVVLDANGTIRWRGEGWSLEHRAKLLELLSPTGTLRELP